MANKIYFWPILQPDDNDDCWVRGYFSTKRFRDFHKYHHHGDSLSQFRVHPQHGVEYFQGSGRVQNHAKQGNGLFKWLLKTIQLEEGLHSSNHQLHQHHQTKRYSKNKREVKLGDFQIVHKLKRSA